VTPLAAAVLLGLMLSSGLPPAGLERPSAEFVARARAATDRYHDRDAAILDGYRLIGGDFPGMGEHWVHIGRLFDGEYDPERPEFLSYVNVKGQPQLLGVAYGLPLLDGEVPPEEPAGREAWHDHRGTLDEETFVPHHHMAGHGSAGPRLAMVHAWIWLPNPDGLFAADNWAIPYLRLGLKVPEQADAAAGKALSLATGGDVAVSQVVVAALRASGREESAGVPGAIRRARRRVEDAVVRDTEAGALRPEAIAALGGVWRDLWDEIEASVDPATRAQLKHQSLR
jgi:hypothetical protein